jgi:hypothetical protein
LPYKDPKARNAYQRKWYADNRKRVIGWVADRKHTAYAGVCINCGGPTIGQTKNDAPRYCHKQECRKAQWREKVGRSEDKSSSKT